MRQPTLEEKAMLVGVDLLVDYPPSHESGALKDDIKAYAGGIIRRTNAEMKRLVPKAVAIFLLILAITVLTTTHYLSPRRKRADKLQRLYVSHIPLLSFESDHSCLIASILEAVHTSLLVGTLLFLHSFFMGVKDMFVSRKLAYKLIERPPTVRPRYLPKMSRKQFRPWNIILIQKGGIDICLAANAQNARDVASSFHQLTRSELIVHLDNVLFIIKGALTQAKRLHENSFFRAGSLPTGILDVVNAYQKIAKGVVKGWKNEPDSFYCVLEKDADDPPQVGIDDDELCFKKWLALICRALAARRHAMLTSNALERRSLDDACIVCRHESVCVAFYPCTHACVCARCAGEIKCRSLAGDRFRSKCPLCRTPIARYIYDSLYDTPRSS